MCWQEVETNAAHAAIPYLAPGGSLMSNGSSQKASTLLTGEQQQLVFRHQAAIGELVRHFWSCFPARTPQLEAKVYIHTRGESILMVNTGSQDAPMFGGLWGETAWGTRKQSKNYTAFA